MRCCRIFLYFSVVAMYCQYWYVISKYWSVLWWCIVGYGNLFSCYVTANVVVMYSVYWCVVFMSCQSWCVMVMYLFLGVNQMYWYVLWRYSVCCGDVIMFVVVKCKLILAKVRYLFILFVMCNTQIVFILKQLATECTQSL